MLDSIIGLRLIVLTGDAVPLPAPMEVVEALTEATVTNDSDNGDGFQLTFSLTRGMVDFPLVSGGAVAPFRRVVLAVIPGGLPEVLIDGVVTHHELSPDEESGGATLTVTGRDLTAMLDLEERSERYENQPDFLIVTQLIASYAQYGLVPNVTPTTDVPISVQRTPWQQETDLRFIERLAERNGFTFFIEPMTIGVNRAYWGPESRLGLPQPALTMNMGNATNVRSLRFTNDALAPVESTGTVVEPITRSAIPVPPLPSLRIPPLAAQSVTARRRTIRRDSAQQSMSTAVTSAVASTTNAPDAVRGQGELETIRYGHVLRARRLVGVRGAGMSYDGNYFVRSVTHTLQPREGNHTQSFTLSREGTGSILPVVRP